MIRLLVLLAVLSSPAAAETARVASGEHADFTRLVIELPAPSDWTLGRTAMGYGFATLAKAQPAYDLSRVWDRIPRSRLQALRADPANGALLLTLACNCHVFPFEVQPGMVAMDIRTGPAPPGSAFEAAFAPATAAQPRDRGPRVRSALAYDWLGLPPAPSDREMPRTLGLKLGVETARLEPLRDELLLQLSRGAVDGVVDMALPGKPIIPEVEGMGDFSGTLVRIGELPGLAVGNFSSEAEVQGGDCIPDDVIDLSSWGEGREPLDLLAEARAGLYEEFDELSADALRRTVRLHLYLGFGAEAAQYGALMAGTGRDADLAPLMSMARLIDGESDPTSPFAAMLGCDGAAALWATLAYSGLPSGVQVDTDAVVRSFQALPPHLRRHLGPRLSDLLLERDADAARMIRDAVERTPDVPAGTVALIDAEADLQASRPEAALKNAETAVREDGSRLAALMALVEARFQSGQPVSSNVADSLRAFRDIAREDVAKRDRALLLALAMSGRAEEAFALAGPDHPDSADLWAVLARQADDNALLGLAVLAPTDPAPPADAKTGLVIAVRLAKLGFPEAALVWLGPVDTSAPPERRLAAAMAQLALGNARQTLLLLTGLSGTEAQALQVTAYQQLGALDAARQVLSRVGQAEESARLATWNSDWDDVKAEGGSAWAEAATIIDPPAVPAPGPLAEGQAALADSAAARSAITALLSEVPPPPP